MGRCSGSGAKSGVFLEDTQVRCHPLCGFWLSVWRKVINYVFAKEGCSPRRYGGTEKRGVGILEGRGWGDGNWMWVGENGILDGRWCAWIFPPVFCCI